MRDRRRFSERGQTAVLVALLMVGLLAATGLAVDGGTAFLERRRMQNAADAAAMAGARQLVMGKVGEVVVDDGAILTTVHEFARVNGVEDPENNVVADYVGYDDDEDESVVLDSVGGGSIPDGATGISATVRIERPARLMQVVGFNVVPARASSVAQTGHPASVVGFRPFGLPEAVWEELDNDSISSVSVHFGHPSHCDPEDEDENVCWVFWNSTGDGDEPAGRQAHRGWWNFREICEEREESCSNCTSQGGASIDDGLQGWMISGWPEWLAIGDEVCSNPGRNNSSLINTISPGDEFCIPVYVNLDPTEKRYKVAGAAYVRVIEVEHTGRDPYIELELADGTCPISSLDTPGEPLRQVWTVAQWE